MIERKYVLVTGAMGGIGTEIVRTLSNKSYNVLACYRPMKCHQFLEWKDENSFSEEVQGVEVDLTSCEMVTEVMTHLAEQYTVGYLVNNAGITKDSSFLKMSADNWESVINCNLSSLFYVTQPLYKKMYQRGFGRIVNISSINGLKGQFGQVNYSAAKAGIIGFTKALALESARKDITVNALAPGYVDTKMVNKIDEQIVNQIIEGIPKSRLAKPEEIASFVEFLLKDEVKFITGETVSVNGGQYMS